MMETSAQNSRPPCYESSEKDFTATSAPVSRNTPLYTHQNTPRPSISVELKALVAVLSSL
jgi:hypothetical protein